MNTRSRVALSLWVFGLLASQAHAASPAADTMRLAQLVQPPDEYGFSLAAVPMAGLERSHECATDLPTFGNPGRQYLAPDGTIAMSNDGGWCWVQFGQVSRSLIFIPKTVVLTPPANGTVEITQMKDRVSVAYRPAAGFAGVDRFEVRTQGPFPHTVPFTVTVRAGS